MAKKWLNDTYHIVDGKQLMLPEYNQWFDMVQRCTSARSKAIRPTYENCTLYSPWLSYDVYLEWAKTQVGFLVRDPAGKLYQLDKDLLGCDYYGPDVCAFIPQELNKFLTGSRGNNPVGCSLLPNGKWRVTIRDPFLGKNVHKGCFASLDAASSVHTLAKGVLARKLADKWDGELDPRVIAALRQ